MLSSNLRGIDISGVARDKSAEKGGSGATCWLTGMMVQVFFFINNSESMNVASEVGWRVSWSIGREHFKGQI